MIRNDSTWSTTFTIKNSASEVDLVAATATSNKSCPGEYGGVAINVSTNKTIGAPCLMDWSGGVYTNGIFAVVASQALLTPDPCRVNLDSAITASMEASLRA